MTGAEGPGLFPAGPGDADAIADLHTQVWREAYRGLVPDAVLDHAGAADERRALWSERLTAGTRSVVVARDGGSVVGAVSWVVAPPSGPGAGVDELASLYVRPGHRGTGLARRLLHAAVADRPAFLWVFEANPRARAFYRGNGFVVEGPRRVDPGTGVVEVLLQRPRRAGTGWWAPSGSNRRPTD